MNQKNIEVHLMGYIVVHDHFSCRLVRPVGSIWERNNQMGRNFLDCRWIRCELRVLVTMFNFQMYRHFMSPGWTMTWGWAKKEVIWSMVGAQTTEQGDCSKFKGNVPHCCKRVPTVVDLLPGVPYNQQIANCCKGVVVASWGQDPASAISAFQVSVGLSGTTNKTVKLPTNFTLLGPGPGYTCGHAKIVPSTVYLTPDRRRKTQALKVKVIWSISDVECDVHLLTTPGVEAPELLRLFVVFLQRDHHSLHQMLLRLSQQKGLYQIRPKSTTLISFILFLLLLKKEIIFFCAINVVSRPDSNKLKMLGINTPKKDNTPLLQCTHHMCPIRVHWHVKVNYKDYWRVKIAITNFNYRMNFTQWTLVAQHPNLNNVTQVFSFDYKPIVPYQSINDTAMFYGMKFYNDLLMEAGESGNVQTEILLKKDKDEFTFKQGWAFPRKIYFNGDECMLPPPDAYPILPNSAYKILTPFSRFAAFLILIIAVSHFL
ncbi:hypothetical protein SASPL_151517 [Salvia splendens]|uniref:COBRA-like protein n=1 Tax=Salvia splendens TaxID=180675 RepID=A0A8X8W9E6_SALSN|nr:hypothetical protein SASPL_151517 [Salvia splendens]